MKKDQAAIVRKCLSNDEPVFALRGQDKCALPALVRYFDECVVNGCKQEFLDDLLDIIEEFKVHQESEITKIPD